jgi:HEAT repeat protein
METSDVRESAARVLGELGNQAIDATPDLIIAMQNDSSINLQNEAARALGKISDKRAIPALADNLYKSDRNLAISSAKAIAMITGEIFSDSASDSGYKLNAQGIPFIVIDAKKWWEEKGQLQDWEYK